MHRLSLAILLLTASCSCSGGPAAGGPTPYVRCAMSEPTTIDRQLGALTLRSEERVLTIEGAGSPVRVAFFRGPALADEPIAPALDAIEATTPAIAVLLGSVGDDSRAEAWIAALAELPLPTLVVLGGRDHQEAVASAIDAIPASAPGVVIDASPFRAIRVAGVELIPVAGAPDGRYARDDESCGLGSADVDAIVSDLGASASPRFLVGFAAPSPLLGIEGGEAGSALVADLASRVSATGGVHAWPDVRGDEPATPSLTAHLLAPPVVGPSVVLADGSRLGSGPLVVEVSPRGLEAIARALIAP